uniref:respirasome Complex Assembly Factor 1-like n=1 Tax=Jaculus jaculus TaxID=51337 RepID=UPI001E1B49D6|nr:respirasome Complex Assembly Factor 1-like [Jaculus jaculus]
MSDPTTLPCPHTNSEPPPSAPPPTHWTSDLLFSAVLGLAPPQSTHKGVLTPDSLSRPHMTSPQAPTPPSGLSPPYMNGGKKQPWKPQLANRVLKVSVWSKALWSDAAWGDKDEFLDVIYWFRQIIAVVLGVIWGVLPLKGRLGIARFCLINAGVLYLYFSNCLQMDEEEHGSTCELTKEGFMTSFALFVVIWIIFYTAIHYN